MSNKRIIVFVLLYLFSVQVFGQKTGEQIKNCLKQKGYNLDAVAKLIKEKGMDEQLFIDYATCAGKDTYTAKEILESEKFDKNLPLVVWNEEDVISVRPSSRPKEEKYYVDIDNSKQKTKITSLNSGIGILFSCLSPDGLIYVEGERSVRFWDVKKGLPICEIHPKQYDDMGNMQGNFTPDTCWFEDNYRFVGLSTLGHRFTFDPVTGNSQLDKIGVQAELKSRIRSPLASTFLALSIANGTKKYESPSKNYNIFFEGVMPYYEVFIQKNDGEKRSLGKTNTSYFLFSEKEDMLFLYDRIIYLEKNFVETPLNRVPASEQFHSFYGHSNMLVSYVNLKKLSWSGKEKDNWLPDSVLDLRFNGAKKEWTIVLYSKDKVRIQKNSDGDFKRTFNLEFSTSELKEAPRLSFNGEYAYVNKVRGGEVWNLKNNSSVPFNKSLGIGGFSTMTQIVFDNDGNIISTEQKDDGKNENGLALKVESKSDYVRKIFGRNSETIWGVIDVEIGSKNFAEYYNKARLGLWDVETGNLIRTVELDGFQNGSLFITFVDYNSITNQFAVLSAVGQEIMLVDGTSGMLKTKIDCKTIARTVKFSHDGSRILHFGEYYLRKQNVQIFDLNNNNLQLKLIPIDNTNYCALGPDNYYMVSKEATKFISFSRGVKTYSFEQFDLKYNRPDIVLQRLEYPEYRIIEAFNRAYKKRLKKMNFTEDMLSSEFHLPELSLQNKNLIPISTTYTILELNLLALDSKFDLDRLNVWVNDVAIYGHKGINLRDKNTKTLKQSISVNLVKGKNKIQVSVLNQAGAESYKETVYIECTAGKAKPDLYMVTIGESEFQQADFNLTYAAKDAQDMVDLFKTSPVYGEVKTKTLVNNQVTKENVLALRSFLEQTDINDEVMVFIAGHGVLDANLDYFFATYDMDFNNPAGRGIAYEDLEGILDGIPALKKTLLIDACHSGEIDKDEVELVAQNTQETGDIQFRAVGKTAAPKLGVESTSELTKSLFTDLRKGTGATVISSAGGMEFAMESGDWSNGLFTYCLLNGIKSKAADLNEDGEIWLSELKKYVSEQVEIQSGGRQKPTSRIENQVLDYRVW